MKSEKQIQKNECDLVFSLFCEEKSSIAARDVIILLVVISGLTFSLH